MSDLLVEKFQCPGCVIGCNTKCGEYKTGPFGFQCISHKSGTLIGIPREGSPFTTLLLGMPKGFDRTTGATIRIFEDIAGPGYNHLNVPVWAQEIDNFLFVRTYLPRTETRYIDVIQGGKIQDLRDLGFNVIDVSEFVDEID